jgi:hypothetical protein
LLTRLALGKLGQLSLDLFHDLDFTLKQFSQRAHSIVVLRPEDPAADQWRFCLFNFGDETRGEFLFGAGNHKV